MEPKIVSLYKILAFTHCRHSYFPCNLPATFGIFCLEAFLFTCARTPVKPYIHENVLKL